MHRRETNQGQLTMMLLISGSMVGQELGGICGLSPIMNKQVKKTEGLSLMEVAIQEVK